MATNFAGEPLDESRDLVATALRGMTFALLLGSSIVAVVLMLVRLMVNRESTGVEGWTPAVLIWGTLAAIAASATAAWLRLAPLGSYYRRGGLAMVSGFGTFVVALLAAPLHHFLGYQGLIGLALISLLGLLFVGRRAQ